ncbi:DNA-directed RNA polymerases I and III subunit RPAC2 [Tolypocladium capitatum]|uniref:DNA-directed RNA polymerases I and III subunit RPAC2 n=1 Tax=Tolypocladium capitatum TaxID=45235 RepID=A0A2K3QB79_9HYPO|nr:DNA-directed RNA polymerases I and III subunit RPAC2 [Tolypocladium capitatum]
MLIDRSPDVEFCAYAIPHPSEPKMNIRIQTYEEHRGPLTRKTEGTAVDALKKGLVDLQEVCDVVAYEFWAKRCAYNDEQGLAR